MRLAGMPAQLQREVEHAATLEIARADGGDAVRVDAGGRGRAVRGRVRRVDVAGSAGRVLHDVATQVR